MAESKMVVEIGGRKIELPVLKSLQAGIDQETVKPKGAGRKKGRKKGTDTVLTNQMVYCVRDITEAVCHFVAGIGAAETLVEMLEEEQHEIQYFAVERGEDRPFKIVAGPQITADYEWNPTKGFPRAVVHKNVQFTKTRVNKRDYQVRIFRYKETRGGKDREEKEHRFAGMWSNLVWRDVMLRNRLKKQGYREPVHIDQESVYQFLVDCNIVSKFDDTPELAKAMMRAIAEQLARFSIYQYPNSSTQYGELEDMTAFLKLDKLPIPVPLDGPYWELVDVLIDDYSRQAVSQKNKRKEVE